MSQTTVGELFSFLENRFPFSLQEDYDNSGFLIGERESIVNGVLVSLDCTTDIVHEAIQHKCNVILSHHPLIFKGLKRLNFTNDVERVVRLAIKNDISIIAIHTNLDNHHLGVNRVIGERLGISNPRILQPKKGELYNLAVFVPKDHLHQLDEAIFKAGAGSIGNYDACRFAGEGEGSFKPLNGANPQEGKIGQREFVKEQKVEYLVPKARLGAVLNAMKTSHPYEEVAHHIYQLDNFHQEIGSGMIGELEQTMNLKDFLNLVKTAFNCGVIRHSGNLEQSVKKVAWCGGAGSFLIGKAMQSKADIYLTGDLKYHDFFIPEERMVLADIGHYESEQFTSDFLVEELNKNFANFAVRLTELSTNPINYF